MQFSVGLVGDYSPQRLMSIARHAEASGLDQIWLADERFYRDVFVSMTVAASVTRRLRIGAMVTDPFVRHPALTASAAVSVDEFSGGRCVLGMGAGISGFAAMGIQRVRPARAIKEAVSLIHRLSAGEQHVTLEGELVRFNDGGLAFTPPRRLPVYVAGRGPRVLQVGGEVADGVVVASFATEAGIRWGLEQVARGAARAGRDLADLHKVSWLYTSISEDPARARDAVRDGVAVAMWGSRTVLERIGVALPPEVLAFMDRHAYGYTADRTGELARMLPDALVDQFSVAGTPGQVVQRLRTVAAMGMDHAAFWIFPPRGESMESVLESLCADVLPALRARQG
jgi:5,10-methylenetetrahydromethanopterin reductase